MATSCWNYFSHHASEVSALNSSFHSCFAPISTAVRTLATVTGEIQNEGVVMLLFCILTQDFLRIRAIEIIRLNEWQMAVNVPESMA